MLAYLATLSFVLVTVPAALAEAETEVSDASTRIELPLAAVSVPMKDWGGRPAVEARINGKGPFKLLVDTGTGFKAYLHDDLVKELGITTTGTLQTHCGKEKLDKITVGTLTIGGATFTGIEGVRANDGPGGAIAGEDFRGILGLPLFKDCLLTLDFPGRRVMLEHGELPEPGGETIAYSADEEHDYGVTVTLSAAGTPVKAHIDTGSPALVTLLNKWQKDLPLKGKPRVMGIARTPQGEARVSVATLDGTLKLGQHEWKNPHIDFADLGPMLDFDAGNIGSRLLKDFAVTIDQKNHRVRFQRNGKTGR